METSDKHLIEELSKENFLLRKLYCEHRDIENMLSKYEKRPFLTSCEEMDVQTLKKTKLRGVDRMMKIISPYKNAA